MTVIFWCERGGGDSPDLTPKGRGGTVLTPDLTLKGRGGAVLT
jgi:hypothetical protein